MMLAAAPDLPPIRLLLLLVPLSLVALVFVRFRLGLLRRLFVGAARSLVQLSALGFVLGPIFGWGSSPVLLALIVLICGSAAFFALGPLRKGPGLRAWPDAVFSIAPVVLGLTLFALAALLPDIEIFSLRYGLSLAGMLAGNAMNATALAGERFLSSIDQRRDEVEMLLLSGATGRAAVQPVAADALRAAVTPSLLSMASVGLVAIPGMMTGQIMAGADPLVAARYQVMIMCLWCAAATLSPAIFLLRLTRRVLIDDRLTLAPEAASRPLFEGKLSVIPLSSGPLAFDERPDAGPETFSAR